MSTLTLGSAFMHQSYTYLGARMDNYMICFIAFLGHQISIQNLPGNSRLLFYLQHRERKFKSTHMMNLITDTIDRGDIRGLGKIIDTGDFPHDYFPVFGAITVTSLVLIFPEWIVDPLL